MSTPATTGTPAVISPEELKIIQEKKKAYEDAVKANSPNAQALATEYFATFIGSLIGNIGTTVPVPPPGPVPVPVPPPAAGCGSNPDPTGEHVKEGGWGADTAAPQTWQSVPMKDDPSMFKVTDAEGKNVAHKFATEAEADKYIQYYVCMDEQGNTEPLPPPPSPVPPTVTGAFPYAVKGTPIGATKKGPLTRHYASGAPDDKTVEMNVKGITFANHQYCVYVTMHKMEHDDTCSIKLGGTHNGTGWFDNSVGIYTGKTGLGNEPDHPSTNLFIIKGPVIGDIREKKIGIACSYFKSINKTELWTDFPAGSGWKKQCEGKDVGGFNPKASTFECQLRIDGFEDEPTIHSAVVTEIGAQEQ